MKDDYKTDVMFRKYPNGDMVALFPYIINDFRGNVMSYMHTGQHSGADYNGVVLYTVPANESEYAGLKSELESIGYDLKIVKKRNYNRFLTELNKIRQ